MRYHDFINQVVQDVKEYAKGHRCSLYDAVNDWEGDGPRGSFRLHKRDRDAVFAKLKREGLDFDSRRGKEPNADAAALFDHHNISIDQSVEWRAYLSEWTTFDEIRRALEAFEVELRIEPDTGSIYLAKCEGSVAPVPSREQLVLAMFGPEPTQENVVPMFLRNQAD